MRTKPAASPSEIGSQDGYLSCNPRRGLEQAIFTVVRRKWNKDVLLIPIVCSEAARMNESDVPSSTPPPTYAIGGSADSRPNQASRGVYSLVGIHTLMEHVVAGLPQHSVSA